MSPPRKERWAHGARAKKCVYRLHFGNGDGIFRADLDTGLTAETFIGMYGLGLAVLHLEHLCRAGIGTFLITGAFVLVNSNFPHGVFLLKHEILTARQAKPSSGRSALVYACALHALDSHPIYRMARAFVKPNIEGAWQAHPARGQPKDIDKHAVEG